MWLKELIETLEIHDRDKRVPLGFNSPHSYRGFYDELAFEPVEDTTVGEMLDCAKEALGKTYEGYKGGEFVMDEYTDCWLSEYGHSSNESIGPTLLKYMLGEY